MKAYPVLSDQHVQHDSEIGHGRLGADQWHLIASIS